MKIREILEQIRNTAGSNDKRAILEANKSELLEQIFTDTYDNSRNYYVKKYNKDYSGSPDIDLLAGFIDTPKLTIDNDYNVFHDMLDTLNSRKITGNAAVNRVEDVISSFIDEDQPVLHAIMERNLKIGIAGESFNKSAANEINKFEVALAYNLDKVKNVNVLDGTYYASRKLDGCVDYYSIIETDLGPLMIGEIIEKNIKCKVKSWDGQNIVYKPIISTFSGNTNKQWYKITLNNGNTIKITENDRLMTTTGWKYVKDLTLNDKIMCD